MRSSTTFAAIFLVVSAGLEASALNDWNVPCLEGQCSYDLPAQPGAPSGSLKIWGSPSAISDITHAAGWSILDCDTDSMNPSIRLVCKTGGPECDHVLDNGAEGKIVRLPENCGKMPFARVARSWVPEDQSVPASAGVTARQNIQVRALALDTNFAAADPTNGNVSFAIQGTSIPGENGDFNITAPGQRRSHIVQRSFISDALKKFSQVTSFNKTITQALPPIDLDKSANLFSTSISCPANQFIPATFSAAVSVDVDAKLHAVVQLGVVAAGTVVPPTITEIGIFAGLDGNIDSTLRLKANGQGSFDSGDIPIFEVGIPGLDFPGILTLGPQFKVTGHVTANLQLDVDATVDLNYNFDGAKLLFPPSEGDSSGNFAKGANKLSISASPTLDASASVEGHLVPNLNIGITALGGAATATVFLKLDASAKLALNTTASARLSASTAGDKNAAASVQGCIGVSSALNVNAGAQGKFLSLFDETKTVSLFSKDFDLFSKCVGAQTAPVASRRDFLAYERQLAKRSGRARDFTVYEKRADLACPDLSPPATSLVDTTVAA